MALPSQTDDLPTLDRAVAVFAAADAYTSKLGRKAMMSDLPDVLAEMADAIRQVQATLRP